MFTTSLLLSASLGQAATNLAPRKRSAVEVFQEACLKGEARFKPEEARPLKRTELPRAVTRELPNWPARSNAEAQFLELTLLEGPAFLAVQTSPGKPANQDSYCSVASKHIAYWGALETVHPHPSQLAEKSSAERKQMDRMGWHRTTSSHGYQIVVRRLDGGYVTLTTILPGDRRLGSREYKRLGKSPGS